ncbi:spatacsin-like isoform X2 [Branchiostoma lanceolatum]|uniref:spatacsin-like isoform X2 n=1 Tax=Branchiostoma lanceolatum TaxID=7740 RepID=UPI003455BFFF
MEVWEETLQFVLQKLQNSVDIQHVREAKVCTKTGTTALLNEDSTISLLKLGGSEQTRSYLRDIKCFKWEEKESSSSVGPYSTADSSLAVVTTGSNLQLHTVRCGNPELTTTRLGSCCIQDIAGPGPIDILEVGADVVTVLVNGRLLCKLAVAEEEEVLSVVSQINVQDKASLVKKTKVVSGILFCLQEDGVVDIFHVASGRKLGKVVINEYLSARNEPLASEENQRLSCFDISNNLTSLVVGNSSSIHHVNLNEYFTLFPHHLCTVVEDPDQPVRRFEGLSEDDLGSFQFLSREVADRSWKSHLRQVRRKVMERSFFQRPGRKTGVSHPAPSYFAAEKEAKYWFEDVPEISLTFKKRGKDLGMHLSYTRKPLTTSGFSASRTVRRPRAREVSQGSEPLSNASLCLPAEVQGCELMLLTVADATAIAWFSPSQKSEMGGNHGLVCQYNLSTGTYKSHRLKKPSLLVQSDDNLHPHLILTDITLSAVAWDAAQEELVNQLMLYAGASVAESLCHINHWDPCSIPIHTLEVGLRHRQLDTVAFFLKSRENVFRPKSRTPAQSPLSPTPPSPPPAPSLDTLQLRAAIDLLVSAIHENIKEPPSKQFAEQLLHLTLDHLHLLIRTATELVADTSHDPFGFSEGSPGPAVSPGFTVDRPQLEQSVQTLMGYVVELRHFLKRPAVRRQADSAESSAEVALSDEGAYKLQLSDEDDKCLKRWETMNKEAMICDAILTSNIPLVQSWLQERAMGQGSGHVHAGKLTSVTDLGLNMALQCLVDKDSPQAWRLLANMGYDVTEQLRRICFYTPNRTLRDFLVEELLKSGSLSAEEQAMVQFVQQVESLYTCQSFQSAKAFLQETATKRDPLQVISQDLTVQASEFLSLHLQCEEIGGAGPMNCENSSYAHLVLEWVRHWDQQTRERVLLERMLAMNRKEENVSKNVSCPSTWAYLTSHHMWNSLLQWIQASFPVEEDREKVVTFTMQGPLTLELVSQLGSCTPFLRDRILDELARRGQFVSDELSKFEDLLRRLARTHQAISQPHVMEGEPLKNLSVLDYHHLFITYCVEKQLPSLLYYYLDFYGLQGDDASLCIPAGCAPWVDMLVQFRHTASRYTDPSAVFQASLANARVFLGVDSVTVQTMVGEGRVLMALATLMYAPENITQALTAPATDADKQWKICPTVLKRSLAAHPKLQSVLFPTHPLGTVPPQDITLYQLLQRNCPFDPSRLFGWQEMNTLSSGSDCLQDMPHFSHQELVSQYAHTEDLQFTYYLRRGRPSFAFAKFLSAEMEARGSLSHRRLLRASLKAYCLALRNFTQPAVTASCVLFLEMLGVDSTKLRVDVQTANTVLSHRVDSMELFGQRRQDMERQQARDITYVFLECVRGKRRAAERILQWLEDATSQHIDKLGLERDSTAASQEWTLPVSFCVVHYLPYTCVFLEDCARADNWLQFTCFVQTHQYPKEQVLKMTGKFSSPHLAEHLKLAFDSLKYTAGSDVMGSDGVRKKKEEGGKAEGQSGVRDIRSQFYMRMGLARGKDSVLSTVDENKPAFSEQFHTSTSVSTIKRQKSPKAVSSTDGSEREDEDTEVQEKTESATVSSTEGVLPADGTVTVTVSAEEKEVDPSSCPDDLFSVLFKCQNTSCPWRSLLAHAAALTAPILAVLAACYEESQLLDCLCVWLLTSLPPSSSVSATANIPAIQWHRWCLLDLDRIIQVAMGTKHIKTLARGFQIFQTESPLVPLFEFAEAFSVKKEYSSSHLCLNKFKDVLSTTRQTPEGRSSTVIKTFGTIEWLESVAVSVFGKLVSGAPHQERSLLLGVLSDTAIQRAFTREVPDYVRIHQLNQLLKETGVRMCVWRMMDITSPEYQQECQQVLVSLQDRKQFDVARQFARLAGLPTGSITVQELLEDLSQLKRSSLWLQEAARVGFWRQCEDKLRRHHTPAAMATDFFQTQAEGLVVEVSDSEDVKVLSNAWEKALLLSMAHRWLASDSDHPASPDMLENLEERMWKSCIQAEVEKGEGGSSVITMSTLLGAQTDYRQELLQTYGKMPVESHVNESLLTTEKECRALDAIIGKLLDQGNISQACKLAAQFQFYSQDLCIILTCLRLVHGTTLVEDIPDRMKALSVSGPRRKIMSLSQSLPRSLSISSISSHASTLSGWTTVDVDDVSNTMEVLADCCVQGKACCNRILAGYKVAQSLDWSFQKVVSSEEFTTLHDLLVSDISHKLRLAKDFILYNHMVQQQVAGFLADAILHSLKVFTGETAPGADSPRTASELVFHPSDGTEGFLKLTKLCSDPSILGNMLLDRATSLEGSLLDTSRGAFSVQVELLIRAHDCHTLCCNMEGISSTLKTARSLTTTLAQAGEFALMIRLLTGIGRFSEMTYIFDTLRKHHQFELLFRKGIDKEDKLKLALLDYLKRYHPTDKDTYTMVCLSFSMYREIAEMMESEAHRSLKKLERVTLEQTPQIQSSLQNIVTFFSDAAESYAKEECLRHASSCIQQARLVALQLHLLGQGCRVINLQGKDVVKFISQHGKFLDALMVAEAYGKQSEWSSALYNNVVLSGDFRYLDDYLAHMSLNSGIFVDIVGRYRREGSKSSQVTGNLKKLLGYCREVHVIYRLATEMGFNDLCVQLLEGDGGAYLRDVA